MSNQDHAYALPVGFMLEEYQIERVLGAGGFGITYYAWDTHLDKAVAIKEYMPSDWAARYDEATVAPKSSSDAGDYDWGLTRFLEEARVLAGFDHPNINRVHRRLQAHGTAYIVLEYLSKGSLSDRLKRTGRLSPEEVWRLFNELLSGLVEVHRQDYVHRDIKPGNIMFRENGGAVLLDFGAARQAIGQRTKSITTMLTPFYAPIEQYDQKAAYVGPWTDFYALGVVAYRCVTGVEEGALLDAPARSLLVLHGEREKDMPLAVEAAKGEYDRRLLKAIDWCMRVDKRERPQGVADLKEALTGVSKVKEKPEPAPKLKPAPKPRPKPNSKPWNPAERAAVGAVLLLLVGIGTWQLLLFGLSAWQWLSSSPQLPDNSGTVSAPAAVPASAAPAGAETAANKRLALAKQPGKVFRDTLGSGGEGPEMVVLPTGRFRMGDLNGDGYSNEKPVRTVTISRPIAMSKYEVTFRQYDRFAQAEGRAMPDDRGWGRGNRPVIDVSQKDAQAYAQWLSAQTGKDYRLPSEAEWEYAARAGTTTKYSWGNRITHEDANYGKDQCCGGLASGRDRWVNTSPVGSFAANPFGLYDMHGNVYEWVEDCWHDNYEGAPTNGSAWMTGCDGDLRAAVRGGSWYYNPRNLRSAYRIRGWPSSRYIGIGFRLVQDINP